MLLKIHKVLHFSLFANIGFIFKKQIHLDTMNLSHQPTSSGWGKPHSDSSGWGKPHSDMPERKQDSMKCVIPPF